MKKVYLLIALFVIIILLIIGIIFVNQTPATNQIEQSQQSQGNVKGNVDRNTNTNNGNASIIPGNTNSNIPNTNNNNTTNGNSTNTQNEQVQGGNVNANEISDNEFSMAGIELRTDIKSAIDRLGNNYTTTQLSNNEYRVNYSNLGIAITFKAYSSDYTDINRIDITGGNYTTDRGIKINSTKDEVLNAYKPENILKNGINEQGDNKYIIAIGREGADYIDDNPEERIWFYIENDRVSEIVYWHGGE